MSVHIPFDNSYVQLGGSFYARVDPTPVASPALIHLNHALAEQLGIDPDGLADYDGVQVLSGNVVPEGAEPLAMAYAGHQFGQFNPQLGDGRAILLGEVVDKNGQRRDIQLKGSGLTKFSRRGDGRAALGPVLREYLVSEFMAAAGVPTTRALAAVTTGEAVYRERALPGAVLTRIASSHIRIGTFQFFAARGEYDSVRQLADYVIARHYPDAKETDNPALSLLTQIIARQAALIPKWLHLGFIHGVMNTDNMSVSGETIDFGPCAFMDGYDPATVFSSIDVDGRYAYGNQSNIAIWNLSRLAEALLPLLAEDKKDAIDMANQALSDFVPLFNHAYEQGMRRKIGLTTEQEDDAALLQDLKSLMRASHADFTLTFRYLDQAKGREQFEDKDAFNAWKTRWTQRLESEGSSPELSQAARNAVNPARIPRNHQIEALIKAAVDHADFQPFRQMHRALEQPFIDNTDFAAYEVPPLPEERVTETFCGT